MPVPTGDIYEWDERSTYIKKPPYFDAHGGPEPRRWRTLTGMRVLALLGDSVTTDHISPAGSIPKDSPAGRYLIAQGVEPKDFNSYGARRGNHEVMVRGTLANIRLRNQLAPGTEGGWTVHLPDGEQMYIYDASMKYQQEGVPLLILAGKEYGSGSSRDWAAKGVVLLGVRAVIAESFERIHRTNLVGMGVLPLQFRPGENAASLGLTGKETFHIEGVRAALERRRRARPRCARWPTTAREKSSPWSCAWIRRRKWNTTATAEFCRTCCGSWRRGRKPATYGRAPVGRCSSTASKTLRAVDRASAASSAVASSGSPG